MNFQIAEIGPGHYADLEKHFNRKTSLIALGRTNGSGIRGVLYMRRPRSISFDREFYENWRSYRTPRPRDGGSAARSRKATNQTAKTALLNLTN